MGDRDLAYKGAVMRAWVGVDEGDESSAWNSELLRD